MASIATINSYMYDCPGMALTSFAGVQSRSLCLHHTLIAHGYPVAIDIGDNALAHYLVDMVCRTTIAHVLICALKGNSYGMVGKMLHMGSEVEQLFLTQLVRMDGLNSKSSLGQCACLVEDHSVNMGQSIHIIATLDEDALATCATNATEERQRNGDDQGTRTTHDEEGQRTIEPGGKRIGVARIETRGNKGEHKGRYDNEGCIDAGKTTNKRLTLRLVLRGVFHESDNLGGCRLAIGLAHPHTKNTREIDTTRDDVVARGHIAWKALTCQRNGIETGCTIEYPSIDRDFLAGTHDDRLTDPKHVWVYLDHIATTLHKGYVGTYVHHFGNRFATSVFGIMLEEFSYLKEKHHKDGFRQLGLAPWEKTDEQGANRGETHEEAFVKGIAVHNAFDSLP